MSNWKYLVVNSENILKESNFIINKTQLMDSKYFLNWFTLLYDKKLMHPKQNPKRSVLLYEIQVK